METKRITSIEGLNHLWKVDNLYLAGQPSEASLQGIKDLGVTKVFNLRGEGEQDFSFEEKGFEKLGISYEQIPILEDKSLSERNCKKLTEQVESEETPFIHCGSANRVGAWLITHLVKSKGMGFEDAVEIASNNGLTNPAFIEQAEDILND